MLTPDEAEAAYRTERAIRAAEVARLRRAGSRRRTADVLRTLARRLEPTRPQDPARSAASHRPQVARPRR